MYKGFSLARTRAERARSLRSRARALASLACYHAARAKGGTFRSPLALPPSAIQGEVLAPQVYEAMRGGRARAPRGFVAPLRSQVFINISAGRPAGCVPRSVAGSPAPLMPPVGCSAPVGSRRSCALRGAASPDGLAKRGLQPRALSSASGGCISVGCRGLLSISAATVRLPLRLDIDSKLPLPPISYIASGLRPACLGALRATPAVNYS